MEFALTGGQLAAGSAAVVPTFILVSGFKMAWPTAPTWSVVLAAFLSGQLASLLTALATGTALNAQSGALVALSGLAATAAAMGIRFLDQKADEKREAARE